MNATTADKQVRPAPGNELDRLRRRVTELEQGAALDRAALDALHASEAKYRLLLDESSDPIFSFAPDGHYLYVNRVFATGVGLTPEDIVGRTIWDIFPPDEADKRFAVVKWVFENGASKVIEVRVPRPNGDNYYITTVKPILDAQGRVTNVICISKNITERKLMEDRLAHMAQHDLLTDLPNRLLFNDRLQLALAQARRDRTRLALMSLDLDQFKPVNDAYGHQVGDLLLQEAARRMQGGVRASDTVGRIGGDEFVVLLPLVEDAEDARVVAEKLRTALARPFDLPGHPDLHVSASIGIAIFPDHGREAIELLKNADDAMYRAKADGRNRAHLCHPT
jgi:diguanylate cyclase (GGDEF)-like protein/PAS domain S-box-containing protein